MHNRFFHSPNPMANYNEWNPIALAAAIKAKKEELVEVEQMELAWACMTSLVALGTTEPMPQSTPPLLALQAQPTRNSTFIHSLSVMLISNSNLAPSIGTNV